MKMPGFTAELALQEYLRSPFWALSRPGSTQEEITPQLYLPTHPICSWPCWVNAQGDCVCPW